MDLKPEDAESVMEVAKESWKWAYAGIYREEFINSWLLENYSKEKANSTDNSEPVTGGHVFYWSL